MKRIKIVFVLFLIVTFLAGVYVILTQKGIAEGLENKDKDVENGDCPDLLIQKGDKLLLYNTKKPIDDTNPIPFLNLDEYIFYLGQQRKQGNSCPVLYLQEENNAQGQDVYRIRPSPFDGQGGLPLITGLPEETVKNAVTKVLDASRDHPPYNAGNYSSFDPYGQYVGVYTNIDEVHESTKKPENSDNPMDPNWGGTQYTQQSVESGKYDENNIFKPMLYQPKMAFVPIENPGFGQPKDIIA
jgi:hypothetical protein